jgi:uncharacterized repeat protein (TIGR02543 family)
MRYLRFGVIILTTAFLWSGCSGSSEDPGETTYTVQFNSQGGSSVEAQQVKSGKTVALPVAPVKEGYSFGGWYKEATCIQVWNFNTHVVTADITLYAKWITATVGNIQWGGNIHGGGNNPQNMANKLRGRNFKQVRMDYYGLDIAYVTKFRNAVTALNAEGIEAHAIVFTDFSKGTSREHDYNANLTEVETTTYQSTKTQVERIKDLVLVYELQNEIPLYDDMNKTGTTGQNISDYDTPAGRLQAAVLKGMYRALEEIRTSNGLPIRIILGTVDRRFGFLKYMEQQGVLFDIVGYHIYPSENHPLLDNDTWFGEGGPIGQLAKFNRPIHVNEFNCGEIYDSNYENEAGQPMTEQGFRSLYKHLTTLISQSVANIEAVHFYEVCDEPNKAAPENRFGLYYDAEMENPKISLLIATAFAGGTLSEAEKALLTERGFTYSGAP